MRQILPLTSARFFAAILVVIFHYGRKNEIFPAGVANFGYEPVTFFFVLSGFVLTFAHGRQAGLNVSHLEFARARAARILPAYLLALLVALPFALRVPTLKLALVPSMLQAWWPDAALLWNSPAWSLSNEMFFYAAFPAIWMVARQLSARSAVALSAVTVLIVAILRALAPDTSVEWHNFSAYFPLLNIPQFIVGVALGKMFLERGPIVRSDLLLLLCCALFCAAVAMKSQYPWVANDIGLPLLFGAMVYSLAGLTGRSQAALSSVPLVKLGSASYALYILHGPIWFWWNHAVVVMMKMNIQPHLDFAIYLVAVVTISVAVEAFVEKPVIRYFRTARAGSLVEFADRVKT